MSDRKSSKHWIGASMLRKEDARHLHGHGMFIADVTMPGVHDIAFVRSQMASAWVRKVAKRPDTAGRVFTLADIGPINVLEAGIATEMPLLENIFPFRWKSGVLTICAINGRPIYPTSWCEPGRFCCEGL
jgi:hypothetical protein